MDEFKSIKKFRIFNTNNLWMKLDAVNRVVTNDELKMEIIVNEKVTYESTHLIDACSATWNADRLRTGIWQSLDDGTKVIQLEQAVGAGIKHFKGACGINVPRSRFLPVKTCSDLFIVKSNLYTILHGSLVMNPARPLPNTPLVKLGDQHFKKVS